MKRTPILSALALALLGARGFAAAQANADAEIDVFLANVDDLSVLGRTGPFPAGINGCALATTACNGGTKEIPWRAAMDPDHPFIAFLVARRANGRIQQISDRSYVKHGFFALSSTQCGTCSPTDGSTLGLGCSDTYGTQNNGDNLWLGPPDEIDPWLGQWNPVCSHFDRGEPPVAPPFDCNGQRSLTSAQAQALGPIGHRIQLRDADLDDAGASYWFQAMYVVESEPESLRADSIGSRAFVPEWTGTRWNLVRGPSVQRGSVLERWTGASIASATNGADDGRLYVGVRVTGPVAGLYHYEYAVHNRDNARGVGALRVPLCAGARVQNAGFSDVDADAANDWGATVAGNELVFASALDPLRWNSIYNFWFDSDAAPDASALTLDQAAPGPGQAAVLVASQAPLVLFNAFAGPGCARGAVPTLYATGTPAQATLGNATFALESTGNAPLQPNTLFFSRAPGSFVLGGCTFFLGSPALVAGTVPSDANGIARHAVPVANDVALEGVEFFVQLVGRRPGGGALFGGFELSDALRVRVGNSVSGCP